MYQPTPNIKIEYLVQNHYMVYPVLWVVGNKSFIYNDAPFHNLKAILYWIVGHKLDSLANKSTQEKILLTGWRCMRQEMMTEDGKVQYVQKWQIC